LRLRLRSRDGDDIEHRACRCEGEPDGKYLLVNGSGAQVVSVFAVNGGNLTEVPSSPTPLPAGATLSSGIVNT
jgi:hypothetical protein